MTALQSPSRPPWWRDEQVLKLIFQAVFATAVLLFLGGLYRNLILGLERLDLSLGFGFLGNSANFGIPEGIPYDPSDSYLKAFLVGGVNTIYVSVVSIFLASLMGLILGMARLSSNWLACNLAAVITEAFRNVPVLLIIIFWYQAVLLPLPGVRDSYSFLGIIFVNQRGVFFPSLLPSWWLLPMLGLLAGVIWLRRLRPDRPLWLRNGLMLLGMAVVILGFYIWAPEAPLNFDVPELNRFNFRGGAQFSAEFSGVMLGLVTYTGAYIGEVVRGSFMAVPKGQWEASRAIGLSELATFRLVIVPQALRIMIPSLNTQYLTLIKNTTLAIAVGYSDLFNISTTIINQSGRSIEVFALMISSYLLLNLIVSSGMNWLNERVKLVER
jgi:general L-amino acid transport system permease protein